MSNTISQIKAELKKVEDAYFYNVYEKKQITNLTKALSVAVNELEEVRTENGSVDDAAKVLKSIAEILSGEGEKK